MAAMESLIMTFIKNHDLDEEVTDSLIELVNGCFAVYVKHMSNEWIRTEPAAVGGDKKSKKSSKSKLENPADAESLEELSTCTSVVLNDYCRTHDLRVGGVKNDLVERVWRHLQGESSDKDTSPRSKPKKADTKKELHACFACNAKGKPCGIGATKQFEDKWFCAHHIDNAEEIIEKMSAKKEPEPPKADSSKADSKTESKIKKPYKKPAQTDKEEKKEEE